MDNMFRLILKITLILACVNIYAEPESIDTAVNTEIESIEAVLTETVVEIIPEEPDVIENEILSEETVGEDLLQSEEKSVLTKDVVLVLDNSGSMKKNDPEFLVNISCKGIY